MSSEVESSVLLPLFFPFQNMSQTYSHLASFNLSWRGFFKVYYKINLLSFELAESTGQLPK